MTEKEIAELRRRFRAEKSNISRVLGCYVNENREIISRFDQSLALMSQEESGRLLAILRKTLSGTPGKNLLEILQQYYYQTDMLRYVSQFDFPLDYVGPEYHVCFRDTTLLQRAVEMGYHVAPWPVGGDESRRDLRSVLLQNPEILVTNKPEIVLAILEGQKLQ